MAVWILEKYYHDFPVYNPALLNLPKSVLAKKVSGFKVYSLGEGERPCSSALLVFSPRQDSKPPPPCFSRPPPSPAFPFPRPLPQALLFCPSPRLQVAGLSC